MESKRRKLNQPVLPELLDVVLCTFRKLPDKGKPQSSEYTTLAAVVATHGTQEPRVISLATGTKCLPATWSCTGRLNDSHAEILARRAALDYILHELSLLQNFETGSGIDQKGQYSPALFERLPSEQQIRLREGVCFHLVVTEMPCGDAAVLEPRAGKLQEHRTGAKPIQACTQLFLK